MVRKMIVAKVKSVIQRGIFGLFFYLKAWTNLSMLVILKEKSQERVSRTDEGDGVKIRFLRL